MSVYAAVALFDQLRPYQIVASREPPTGVGEPGVPPACSALANAIFAATGKHIIRLPMTENGIEFV